VNPPVARTNGVRNLAALRPRRRRSANLSRVVRIERNDLKRNAVITSLIMSAVVALVGWKVGQMKRHRDTDPLAAEVLRRIVQAGGVAKVCDEADRMFARFGTGQLRFLSDSELNDFPAVTSLGTVDGIWPGNPTYIKVRAGTHLSGFVIQILSTNSSPQREQGSTEVVKSRIYAHR
jgi:hypothetical protein